jgi:tetratricopeptide (TPR) repeat protein
VIPFFFFESAMLNEKEGNITKEEVLEAYDIASVYLEKMYKANPKDTLLAHALSNLDIAFEPYATCDEIIPLYEKKYDANKDNVEFLEKICKVMARKDCNESELFFKASEALHGLKPTPGTAYLMAKMCDGKKLYNEVITYLSFDVIAQIESERDKISAYLLLAKACTQESKYREGREAVEKALALSPNDGRAYILLGSLYAQSARICGDEPEVSQKAGYWLAVDQFRKAKEVDPIRAEQADMLISTYSQHFPTNNDLFMRGYTEGASYTVGCWIQRSTVIRSRR